MILSHVPAEAKETGAQPMRCDSCGEEYRLPLYEMPDGPIVVLARCPRCGNREHQVPDEVAS